MNKPICEFIQNYIQQQTNRYHMPGHKGKGPLGFEQYDITEINGADSLFEAEGIILESEENASKLFNSFLTLYSCGGSTSAIQTMLFLSIQYAFIKGRKKKIIAGRNAHKSFLNTCSLLDIEVEWFIDHDNYLKCTPSPSLVKKIIEENKNDLPAAIYLTSPDYLGNICDIQEIAKICHRYDILFLVDNAHGAYLHFLDATIHPLDLGADLTSDSAHKTLPVLTGGAYLHISSHFANMIQKDQNEIRDLCKKAMSIFTSTSPSYLILQSLDACNELLEKDYPKQIQEYSKNIARIKLELEDFGYQLIGDEPLKITIKPKNLGYTGIQLASYLRENHIECEFSDPDFVVLMITPLNSIASLAHLKKILLSLPIKKAIQEIILPITRPIQIMNMHSALLSEHETVLVDHSVGKILAMANVGCPPAVPIVMCGEIISKEAIEVFHYYGIETVDVVKEKIAK